MFSFLAPYLSAFTTRPMPRYAGFPTVAELIHARLKEGSTPQTRRDPFKLAVVAEEGGMRWPVLGGMLARLEAHGMMPDLIVGTSGGGEAAAFYAAGQARHGVLAAHYLSAQGAQSHPRGHKFIDKSRLMTRKPVMDIEDAVETVFAQLLQLDFDALRQAVPTYLTASTRQGAPVLQPLHGVPLSSQKLAMKNTSRIPVLAHSVADHAVMWDGALTAGFPVPQAFSLGATHVLALRCKPLDMKKLPIAAIEKKVVWPMLAKRAPDMLKLLKNREHFHRAVMDFLATRPPRVQVVGLPTVGLGLATDREGPLFRHAVKGYQHLGYALGLPPMPLPQEWTNLIEKYLTSQSHPD